MEKNYKSDKTLNVIKVHRDDLTLHPILSKIYAYKDFKAIKALAKTMRSAGLLEPITINSQNQILSGGRRWKAAYHADIIELDAICIENDALDETLNIVYHNQQRNKSTQEIINEAEAILGILGRKQGERNDL